MRMDDKSLRRARAVAAAVALIGVALVAWGFSSIENDPPVDLLLSAIMTVGGLAAIGGFVAARAEHFELRRLDRMRRGARIARWRVDPRRWQQLIDLDLALAQDGAARPNMLAKPKGRSGRRRRGACRMGHAGGRR